jgi:multiple antibiotic resistance protein
MMLDWLTLIGGTIATLLPIANPFSTAPVFASITSGYSEDERNRQARLAAIYMTGVLLVTLFFGALVLTFFGIGMPALRIAGGLLIARVGFSMVNPEPQELVSEDSKTEALNKQEIAFTPIAMPLLSGPGSMAATLSMCSYAQGPLDYASVAIGIGIVAFISWLVLRSSTTVADRLGVTGMNALTRVMGLILVCVGIRFIATGFFEGLTDPAIMGPLVDAVRQALET